MSRSDLHARLAPDESAVVAQVAWPEEAGRRWALAQEGVARLVFVAPGHAPPAPLDLYEDWVRVPATASEVELRSANLRRRVLERDGPTG